VSARDDPRALIRYALAGAVVTGAIAWALFVVRDALLVIYISAIVAIGLAPVVRAIERRGPTLRGHIRLPRWLAILLIYVLVLGTIIAIGISIVPPLVAQARELWERLPDLLHRGQQFLIRMGLLTRELTVREAVQDAPVGGDALGTVFGAVWGVVGGVFGFVTILILAFYMLVDAENIVRTFVRLFPRAERSRVDDACRRVSLKVSAWLAGQVLLAAIIGGTAALALFLLGVPYFYVLALIAGIGEMIPIIGPIIAAIPAILVALTVSPTQALGVLIFFVVQQQFENHVLVPKVMERQVGVSAVAVIIALLIGGSLLGVLGAILAVPTAAILQVLFEELGPEE
jgi:predicted PurR-regulated permease PerM